MTTIVVTGPDIPPKPDPRAEVCSAGSGSSCGLMAFEGPEKLLELWFGSEGPKCKPLLDVPREMWVKVLDKVHCLILSVIQNDDAHAYLLSESSFFVFKDKLILKTCGTTTLLDAVPMILEIAQDYCGFMEVKNAFYSRQNFFYPHKQVFPHKDFRDEAAFLDTIFEYGAAYTIGRINGTHYHFYNADKQLDSPDTDQTLEIMMSELDPVLMRKYFYADSFQKDVTTKECGITDLLPGAIIDDYIFEPFGYSMNGILGDSYCTIHVTPQEGCSYASFETNAPLESYTELVGKVLAIFNPGYFMVVTCHNDITTGVGTACGKKGSLVDAGALETLGNYRLGENAFYHFQHYDLSFLAFAKANHEPSPRRLANTPLLKAKPTPVSTAALPTLENL